MKLLGFGGNIYIQRHIKCIGKFIKKIQERLIYELLVEKLQLLFLHQEL